MFRLFRYRSETPEQTENNFFGFGFAKKTNQKTTETDCVSVCFGSNQEKKI